MRISPAVVLLWMWRKFVWAVMPTPALGSVHWSLKESGSAVHRINRRDNQKPAKPCGLLYGIWTVVTSWSEPFGCAEYPTSLHAFP